MVSKNNVQVKDRYATKQVPHYGIRKLSVGVASVLLGTTFYMGMNGNVVHADTVNGQDSETPDSQVANNSNGSSDSVADHSAANTALGDKQANGSAVTNEVNAKPQVTEIKNDSHVQSDAANTKLDASTSVNTAANTNTNTQSGAVNTNANVNTQANTNANEQSQNDQNRTNATQSMQVMRVASRVGNVSSNALNASLAETTKPVTAWQPEPITNYSADHTAKIDMTNQPTTVHGDNWQMSLDKNYIKAGQDATLTVNYKAQAGDTFVLDIGYPAGVNAQPLSSQIGTTSTKDNGLRTQVTNVFKQAGTYTQVIKLNGWKKSAEGLELLRRAFGDQAFDLTLKRGTSVENAQDVGRLYLTSSFTPTMTGTGSVGVDRIDAKYVPVLSTNNNYIFTVRTDWSDYGAATDYGFLLDPSYNGDFVYSISVPKTFELDQTATEAFYQQIYNNELFGRWGIRGSNVIASQAGVGAPVVIKANALDRVAWHYTGNEGVSFLGHFVDAPSVATTVIAEGQTTVSDTIGGHVQTITLPGLSAKVINAADYNYADSDATTVFSLSDYGDHNQLYQSHEVPMTGNGNSISLINDLTVENNSPFDVKNATITLTFGDGLHVDVDSVRNNSYISNLLADNYIHPNREKSLLVTYQDGTREMVPANSKGDPNKNIKSITLTRDWNAGQMAGMHGDGIRGFVASTYQDGSPVKIGDTINVSLTVSGVNTVGRNVSKSFHDTLKVVDQQFAPLTTESYYGGVDKSGLGDDPSGTINLKWKRTSGERGKIQLENPTIYFVMPNTVSQIKNISWGSGKDAPGNSSPTLSSITYEKSKDGKNTVAIMHFSGALIDQVPNQNVPLYFDTVNKDNVTNQQSEGYLYWTADNVNADGLTKIDPTRADSQNKVGHLPADLTQEQLNKIYFHAPFWGSINMATGMYSTSATKMATTPWQTQTIVDYHGDGQADVGVNLVNDTSNELHNVVAIINLPKASSNSNLTVNLTGNKVELIDPNTNSKLTDDVTVLYSTKSADLSSNDLSSFVTADQIKDWSKVQAVAVTLQSLDGLTSRQVQIPVVVNDLVANAGKAGTVGTRISADELKPIIVSADAENAAKLVVGGQAIIHVQMHYQDAQGKDHYVPLTNSTHAYDILQHHVLNSSDFTPSTTDLAQVPGYELSKASPTIVSGNAVIGQPVLAQDDGSVLQFELVPSAQKVLINYVDDDDDQKVIKTDTLTGKTGETQKINIVTPDNYVLVDPAANPSEYTFLASDNKPITIHLKHATHIINDSRTVTETVHYQSADGSQVPSDYLAKANFSRTGTHDEVTGADHWNAWNSSSHEFDAVLTPVKTGYTSDVQTVPAETVTPSSDDIRKVVTYTPDAQKLNVKFIDDTTGRVLKTVAKTGVTNANSGYNTQSDIQSYEGQHYVLVSDSSNGANLVFDNNDSTDQAYEVHLKHGTHQIDEHHTITQTVHYTATDHASVPDDHTVSVQFDRDGYHDEVTGVDHWNAWKQGGTQTFTEVSTPKKAGYTPDKSSVPATVVHPSDHNQAITVTYTPDTQKVIVTFIDDTDNGKTLKTVTKTGPTNSNVGYTTGDDINTYKGQHYVLVSDQTHGQSITFDTDTNTDQRYEVHLKHATHQINDHRTITETVHYKMTDGTTAPADHTVKIEFSRDGFNDEVTGADHWNAWTPAATHQFDAVHSPEVKGYTPDADQIAAVTVNPDSQNIERTVTYSPDAQKLDVTFIDDTAGITLKTVVKNGVTRADAKYNTKSDIQNFESQHYVLVSDSSNGAELVFDDDDAVDQHYTVHLKHATHAIKEHHTVNETIHYTAADDSKVPVDHIADVQFDRDGFNDEVTGTDHWNAWTPSATQKFAEVPTPAKTGYTPDLQAVSAKTVGPTDGDINVTVTYAPDVQKLDVKFIDDSDNGKVLKTVAKSGATNADAGYNTQSDIDSYKSQHYVLVSDSSNGQALKFDDQTGTDQHYVVHLKHATHAIKEHHTVSETVHYAAADGSNVPADHTADVQFDRDGFNDEVNGTDHWNAWTPSATQKFAEVPTPAKTGYTPDLQAVSAKTVGPTDGDINVTVTYAPDVQKLDVKFIDDSDNGKVLKTVAKSGATNTDAGYNTESDIQNFEGQHYILVIDSSKGQALKFDDQTGTDQHYEVHLKHAIHAINEHHTVNETIHYAAADGSKVSDDHTASVQFDRDGFNDEVTGTDHWNAWKQGNTQTFAEVPTPVKKGYTPDVQSVDAVTVNPTDQDVKRTVTYTPDAQKLDVTFIDDTAGTTLKTVAKTGVTNADAKYSTQSDIQSYEGQHYVLVSDSSNGAELVFDDDDSVDQHYVVHLKHNTHAISEHHTVNETVHYKMSDGTKAPADYHAKALSFSRDGFNDEVTGIDHWNAWTPNAEQTFDKVASPLVAGYTPDSDQINAQTVKPTDTDLEFTVTYSPNVQLAHVKYIDDTDHKVLTQDDLNGRTGETSGYHTADRITEFKRQHYVFVSDNYPAEGMTFDNHDRIDQTYEVHFKHATRTDEQDVQVPRTIKYVYQDGRPAQPDHTDALKFHETKVVDLVDGHTVSDDWTFAQDFKTIETPAIQGYTPDHSSISNTGIAHDHSAIVETVTYNPDAQKVVVKYIDDTTGEQLEAKDLTGVSDQSTGYSTKDTIDGYINQHYVLVRDDTDGKTVVFDHDDQQNQSYEVHLKHGTEPANESRTKKITVHYQYADGSARSGKAADDQTVASLTFKRTGTHDLVTDKTAWNAWDHSAQTFAEIDSSAIEGYTPDQAKISDVSVTADSPEMTEKTVVYHADAQKLSVKFIDDPTGKTLKTVAKIGHSDESAGYSTKSDLQSYLAKHYDLVSDQTNGESLVFDHDDKADQHYEVHLTHHLTPINEQHTITETIHYQYADGLARSGKAADDYHADALKFSRTGNHDNVTDSDHWNAWTPADQQTFDRVQSPAIEGYTPDQAQIDAVTMTPDSQSIEKTVTYTADAQKLTVNFIDDTTGKTLKTISKDGHSDEAVGYNTKSDLQSYLVQHYDLVSDDTKGQDLIFDHDDSQNQVYNVHLSHHTHKIDEQHTVAETIHYVYADGLARSGKAADDFTVHALKFSRDGFNDEVTGIDHWNAWTPSDHQTFAAVQSPAIEGYTPDQAQIDAVTVDPDSQSIEKTVVYTADAQKLSVNFIDDTTGKTLKTVTKTGRSDEAAGYSTKSDIQNFVGQHYDLVSDATNGADLVFDHNDGADQAYDVHLSHHTHKINEQHTVAETVHYQYADGLARTGKAADDFTAAPLSFSRDGFNDEVTGADHWNAWTPADHQTFAAVQSPVIEGYTPDQAQIDAVTIDPDSQNIEKTVTYSADGQKLTVNFIDDTTGKTLKTVDKDGHSDESAVYSTKSDLQSYLAKHYDLVSDDTHGQDLVFDHDDSQNQVYNVHLIHHTHPINEHHTVTETVHYQYADGLARSGKAADDFNATLLSFSRDGFNDEVTGIDHWNAWTPADHQMFAAVQSPAIEGYTPDQSEIGIINVVPTSQSIEKTVTYSADQQKLTVNFIDDTTGETLKTVAKTGRSDEAAGYSTKSDLQSYLAKHYDLVSDATKGADLVFDHNDAVDQAYDVHLTHHLTPISDHQVVNETIHYVYADGLARTGKAADDYVAAPLEFSRTGKHDDVTGTDAWDAWIPGNSNFAAVQSPLIQGYTPDQSQIDVIPVDANSQDVVKTVTYSADQQTVTVDFIDDTDNGKVLKTVTKTGGSDEAVGYNTKADIQIFVDGHYKLDHDTSNGENLVFDHDDAVDQHYEVHLTHATAPISEATSTNQVIHYQLADGTPVAKDYTAKVDFSRDGFKDLVTNADHWNAWTPNATQTFDAVASPVKAGYTVDHARVDAVTVEPHHADLETTVTYSPDAQKSTVKYVDDTTGKTLQTKELTGVSDETSAYTTESTINQYVGQHYKLVSDQTNGKPVVFDHDDGSDQVFEVHLAHTYQNVSQEHQVHQTIHYQFADGKEARPDYTAAVLAFSRTGTQDLVTENIQWNAWTPDQVFAAVNTPAVNGYTPDVQTVALVKVGHNSKDIEQTVVYHADDQTILVNYIDDDTHSTLKTDSIIGKTAQTSDYTTKKSLDQYKGQHYDVVSDDTNGNTLKFDSDSTKVQTYNVHLKHQHQAASDKSTVHQTVHYVYQDGKQAAKDHTAAPIEFTRTGDTDLVTGKTTWNAWTPATGTFVAVLSPAIAGYTPSRAMINHVDVHPGDKDLDTTVTYVPDQQVIVVNYIDQTTGKTLKTDTLNGRSDQTSSYATKSQINSYLGQHYKLISDDTNGQTLTFDHDDQATQTYDVVLGHQTEAAHRTHEVRETVDYAYADGSQAAKSFAAQPLVFSQTGVHDLVTNTTDWNGEWTKPQVFAAVESPKIIGFTANKPEVKAVEVNHQSSDVHELVIYAANAQTAQIKYIDDVTGKTLETDGANGHFGESIVFGHNVNDQINKFKQAHYKLVSNNFAGQKYQADNTKNVYEVHLIHERQNVHATDSVTETVKFQYADGLQAQPTKTQTVNFGRDGIKDLVTGTTAWMPVDPQTIGAVNVPAIDGYTADTDQVPAVKVNFDDNDIEKVVTYTANDQTAGIKIIDDATGKVLNTQSATGKFGTEIQFKQNPDQQVIDLQAQHYELVSDNFNHQKYQADNAKNQFEIHVKHQMMDVQRTDKVTETVRYQDNHGNMLHPVTTQTKMFTEHGITDKVTGKTVWTPSKSQTMDAVSVPEITGYTPDKHSVPAATVNFGDKDINEVIVYTPVSETANIKYIDDTTGKTLLSDQVTGDFGSQIKFDHDPLAQINQYEGQGYELVSNSYGKTVHQFSATSGENNFEVHFKHGTMPVIDTDTVTETIHYLGPDGNKLAPDNTQTITFTRHGIKDQVTGQIDWNSVEPQEFNAVKSPVINGYQADIAVVEGRQVLFGDQDVVVNVHYTKLPEQQPGKQLGTDMVNTGKVTPKKVVTVANGTVQETKQDAIKNSGQSTMQDTKQLPQTGNDNRAGLLSLIGSSLMASLAIFGLSKKKKHEN